MLPKRERLDKKTFNQVFSTGKQSHSPVARIIYKKHNNLHVAVVVSKKVETQAIKRNKIRRRVYDIVRRCKKEQEISGVFIIIVKSSNLPYQSIKDEISTQITTISKR